MKLRWTFDSLRTEPARPRLDAALAGWRAAERAEAGQRLSPAARAAVLRGARGAGEPSGAALEASLFPTPRRLALGALAPALLLALMLGWLGRGADRTVAPTEVRAAKQGDELVFLIANGKRTHRIERSTAPAGRRGGERFVTRDGTFRERLEAGDGLVLYRID